MILPLFSLLFVALQTPPAAASATVSPTPTPPSASSETTLPGVDVRASSQSQTAEPKRVCRTEPVTGSRFGRQVCRNASQTQAERDEARQALERMQGLRRPE